MFAEVVQCDCGEPRFPQKCCDRARHEDLAAVRNGHEASGPVQGRTEVVAVALLRCPAVDCHADLEVKRRVEASATQRLLRLDRRSHGAFRSRKSSCEPIASGRKDEPVMAVDRGPQDLIMPAQRNPHRLRRLIPQARRANDVGEKEGDRPGRDRLHEPSLPHESTGPRPSPDRQQRTHGKGNGARHRHRALAEPS